MNHPPAKALRAKFKVSRASVGRVCPAQNPSSVWILRSSKAGSLCDA